MLHAITLSANLFSQTVRDAVNYASKDIINDHGLHCLVLTLQNKTKTLSVIACDGTGYYERKLPLVWSKGTPKPSLPNARICITAQDAIRIAKLIPARSCGNVTLEINDTVSPKENHYQLSLILPDGGTSTFLSPNDVTLPDYNGLVHRAEKGKKGKADMQNLYLPIQELTRVAKVLPKKDDSISFAMNKEEVGGLVLLEYQIPEESLNLRIIFTLSHKPCEAKAAYQR